jgi:uncharacterized protein YjiS (DUF1127 family)
MSISNNTYLISGSHATTRPWLSQVMARLHDLRAAWAARRGRLREMQDLYRCNDRELRDMGLSRSDLLAIQKGTYRRD